MNKLHIFFGINGDSPVYHNYSTSAGTYMGKILAGPLKLLEQLELRFGLCGIFPTELTRVLSLKDKLSKIPEQDFPFSASFKNDPVGVSKRLLKLWDTWRISGWNEENTEELPLRMRQILKLRAAFLQIEDGEVERIKRVLCQLKIEILPDIFVYLIDPIDSYPYLYQQLLKNLSLHNLPASEESGIPEPDTDLRKLQAVLSGKELHAELTNDHTFQILFFPNDFMTANAIYNIQQFGKWNPVIVSNDNDLMNGLHLLNNTPICNWRSSTGRSQVSQLFFLVTALFKRPANTSQILSFLSSKISPLPKELSRKLQQAFSNKPGIGNDDWNSAITVFLNSKKDDLNQKKIEKRIRFWLQNNQTLDEANIDLIFLKDIYNNLKNWAIECSNVPYYERYLAQLKNLASLCTQLLAALDAEETMTLVKFERLQSEIFSEVPITLAEAQEGSSDTISNCGGIWSQADEILWMNVSQSKSPEFLSKFWYQEEKDFFKKQNLPVQDENHLSQIEKQGLLRMVLSAKERLIIALPSKINGEDAVKPYFLNEWESIISLKSVMKRVDPLLENIPWESEDKLTNLFKLVSLPLPQEYINIKGDDFVRDSESYSSLEKLFQHPAKWYLDYRLKIKYADGISLPGEVLLKGTVADSVVQIIFKEENRQADWWKESDLFPGKINEVCNIVLSGEGLPFLEKTQRRFLMEYKKVLVVSLGNLRDFLDKNGFKIIGTQYKVKGVIDNTPFAGYIDILLSRNGRFSVIDLKWAGKSTNYSDRLKTGTDLQLSLYQTLEGNSERSGYFLLNDGKMYMRNETDNEHLHHVEIVPSDEGVSTKNVYEKAVNSLRYRRGEISSGRLEVCYDIPVDEIEYSANTIKENLFPLTETNKPVYKRYLYDNDLDLFFGKIK